MTTQRADQIEYPSLRRQIRHIIAVQGTRRFLLSYIADATKASGAYASAIHEWGLMSLDQQVIWSKNFTRMVKEEVARPRRSIKDPATGQPFIHLRVYQTFQYAGDNFYVHLDGVSDENATLIWMSKHNIREHAVKHANVWDVLAETINTQKITGLRVDWDEVVRAYHTKYGA